MIDIAAIRQSLANELRTTLAEVGPVNVYAQPPERPAFPAVIITEADAEFITPDPDRFGGYLIRWQALVACRPSASNRVMTAEADALVSVILELANLDPEIQTYATATLAGQTYLVASITLTTHT